MVLRVRGYAVIGSKAIAEQMPWHESPPATPEALALASEERADAVRGLAGPVSHEICNALIGIPGAVEALAQAARALDEVRRRSLEAPSSLGQFWARDENGLLAGDLRAVHDELGIVQRRLHSLAMELRSLGTATSGAMADLDEAVGAAWRITRARLRTDFRLALGDGGAVSCEPGALMHLVSELLLCADAAASGRVAIVEIRSHRVPGGAVLELAGASMAEHSGRRPADQQRADLRTALCTETAERLGCELAVEDSPGGAVRVVLTLPAP
jgi:signal transduction histidine kinase